MSDAITGTGQPKDREALKQRVVEARQMVGSASGGPEVRRP